jgi:crotonobetainyl-CoA:carnitine CoA-transferase CaiB-like acyl-CoA transferase
MTSPGARPPHPTLSPRGGEGGREGGPLDGIKVVDLTSYIAGSYGAMMLADLGADVVKVEAIEGDSFRELSGFYGWNRGKRSLAVNLKEPDGRTIVHRLAEHADVVMENMRPGVVERLGVDYETLRAINPRLIYSTVTAFGSDGPYKDRPGFDPLLQAMGGLMTLQGFGEAPQYLRIAPTDYYCAALACQAILAALFVRERSGRGQRVQTSLLQAVLALQSGLVVDYPGHEVVYRNTPTYRLYQAGDGESFFLAVGNQSFWVKLCKVVGREDLAQDPRFGSWIARRDNAEALMPLLESAFASRPAAEWVRILTDNDIPAALTQSLQQFMRDPAVLHHKMVVQYDHPELGPLSLMGQPLRFSETQAPDAGPPPTLGQHTAQVLRQAGYADHEIADLRRRGVVAGKDSAP